MVYKFQKIRNFEYLKKKILIIGGSSLLSINLVYFLKKFFLIYLGCFTKKPKIKEIESLYIKKDYSNLCKIINTINPDYILICSAITNIEYCEKNKEKSKKINYDLIKIIVNFLKIKKTKIIFFSTDQVYDGNIEFSKEIGKINPLNFYSKLKIKSENYIIKKSNNYLIFRLNFFGYGPNYRKSFSDNIIFQNKKKKIYNYFIDSFFSPIYLPYIARVLIQFMKKDLKGVYNLCSPNKMSKYQFAKYMYPIFNLKDKFLGKNFLKNNKKLVTRPIDMSMSNLKLQSKIDFKIPIIQKQIVKMKKDYISSEYFKFIKNIKTL